MKNWYESKTVWLGVMMTLLGVANYFADPSHTPQANVASVATAIVGIMTVVVRVWFTNMPISDKATKDMEKEATKEIIKTPEL